MSPSRRPERNVRRSQYVNDKYKALHGRRIEGIVNLAVVENDDLPLLVVPYLASFISATKTPPHPHLVVHPQATAVELCRTGEGRRRLRELGHLEREVTPKDMVCEVRPAGVLPQLGSASELAKETRSTHGRAGPQSAKERRADVGYSSEQGGCAGAVLVGGADPDGVRGVVGGEGVQEGEHRPLVRLT